MKRMVNSMLTGVLLLGAVAATQAQEKASWTDNVTLKGDVRFRYQNTDEDGKDARERWRFRGRISLGAKISDDLKADLRLVTNTGDPISDNQTMSGAFDDKPARFDRAVFTWTPADDLALRFGKMGQPWIAVDDLVFSGDVNPEGIAANYAVKGDSIALMLHGGGFMIEERSSDDETMLYTGQAAIKIKAGNGSITLGSSIYAYDNVEGQRLLGPSAASAYGNTTRKIGEGDDAYSVYANGYTIFEAFVQAGFKMGTIPVTLGGQYMVNSDANRDDTGYLGMFQARLTDALRVGYQYRYVEKDANLGIFAENTDFGNGTNASGHIPYVQYQIGKNYNIKVQYAIGERGLDNGKDISTFKIDLAASF